MQWADQAFGESARWDLGLRAHRRQIAFTYGLTLLENVCLSLYPWAIGIGIDGLLAGAGSQAVLPFACVWAIHITFAAWRQSYDTRLFTRIYATTASGFATAQRAAGVGTATVAARTTMARELIEFFEREVPVLATTGTGLAVGIGLLLTYDALAGAVMAALVVPTVLLNRHYGGRALRLNRGLNDRLEREVEVVARGDRTALERHFAAIRRWRVRLSDADVRNASAIEIFSALAVLTVLFRITAGPDVQAGQVFAALVYALDITDRLRGIPYVVQQVARLIDIRRRLEPVA